MISLTVEERRKFAAYCEQEALGIEGIAKQMEMMKLPLAKIYHARAATFARVARELNGIEEQSL